MLICYIQAENWWIKILKYSILNQIRWVYSIFISSIAAKIINLSYFCSLYLGLLTNKGYLPFILWPQAR